MSVLYEMKMFSFLKLSISIDDIWKNKIDIYRYIEMIKNYIWELNAFYSVHVSDVKKAYLWK